MPGGTIIKAFNNFFLVAADEHEYLCTLRGRLKQEHRRILTGDRVEFTQLEEEKGVIEAILPRVNELIRPPIANVEKAIVVVAVDNSASNRLLLDKILVMTGNTSVNALICVNKADRLWAMDPDSAVRAEWENLIAVYRQIGYPVVLTSAKTGEGLSELREACQDQVAVLAGVSGVGKSSLMNALQPGLMLKTGELSAKQGRGKHTTRQVSLLRVAPRGFIADTPGFSAYELQGIAIRDLSGCFPELDALAGQCRFNGCLHWHEPDCAVKAAVERGEIDRQRYLHYTTFLTEINASERRY